eukprot:jgi/Psemu1/255572/estExt_Genewise1Plus.C_1450049
MNQELLEEETQYSEYSYGEEDGDSDRDRDSSNDNSSYDIDDDYNKNYNEISGAGASTGAGTVEWNDESPNETKTETETGRTSDDSNANANANAGQSKTDDEDCNSFEIKGPLVLWDDDDYDIVGGGGGGGNTNGYGFSFPLSSASAAECNTHGVVHVRLLRARNLPCPVGSTVGATVSLPPYNGKVKNIRSKAFVGSTLDHGVCNRLSMVNAWNGPDSPVPSIQIDLTFSPLGLGIFDFTMASIQLSSAVLLQRPKVWRTRWCPMTVTSNSSSQANYHHNYNDDPFIRVQALFEPSVSDAGPVPVETHNNKTEPSNTVGDPSSFWDTNELSLMNVDTVSLNDDVSIAASRKTNATQRTAQAATALVKPHLLRTERYWSPARCAVCSKLLVGILRGVGFRCEVCHIDCCSDCRLHVDLKVPCGSDLASDIVEASFRNQMSTSVLLSYIAPDEAYERSRQSALEEHSKSRKNATSAIITSKHTPEGIGRCRFEIVTACLFQQNTDSLDDSTRTSGVELPPMRKGDYYVRVLMSGSDTSARTPTLQKTEGMPHFRSAEMRFPISHYGVDFRIDVVEANTDTIIGSAFLTTQGILQEQRDAYIAERGVSLLQFFKGPIPWMGTRKVRLVLQSGIKAGASADEFYSSNTSSKGSSARRKGSISGWIDICVGVEEFYSRLYGQNPIECPKRPPADLNIAMFSNYIGRIKAIIDDMNHAISMYQYMVSWKDPAWTATTLAIFLCFCLLFNTEYSGSLPILCFVVFLGYSASQRNKGKMKGRYVQKEVETMQKVEGNSIGYEIHRPRGTVTVAVRKGRNLLSQEFGIAGKTSCKVIWDPLRFADEDTRKRIVQADKSADTPFEMGDTPTIYTSDPDWNKLDESAIAKRLNQLLPSTTNDFFDSSNETGSTTGITSLSFPVLQPFNNSDLETDSFKLEAWESSQGAVVLQVKFQDFFNNIPGFDYVLGEVVIPFGDLAIERELKGWFQILKVGTTSYIQLEDHEVDRQDFLCGTTINPPRIHVHIKWDPQNCDPQDSGDEEQEMSYAIQEELLRSSTLLKENKVNLVDTSIGSVSKAFGIGGTIQVVQNTLGSIIDLIEGVINILNFTDPYKSSTIFVSSVLVWVLFCIIPTRYIVLLAGLVQYGVTFVDRCKKRYFGWKSKKKAAESASEAFKNKETNADDDQTKSKPFVTKIANAIRSIPTNEDLRKTYFWESRHLGTEKSKKYAVEKRESRLEKLWKARWHSEIKILVQDNEIDQSRQPLFHWETGFAVVQGHRFIWWKSVDDFDDGELPSGKLILSGHAGLGGPSPIEMRKLDKEKELPFCLTVFGRGYAGQERVTMLLLNPKVKQNLENAILHSASFKTD